jgi:hypothetical protein
VKKAKKGFAPVLALLALFIGVSLVAGIVFINSGVQKQSSQPDLNIRQKENTNSSDTSKKQRGNSLKIDEPPVYGESETFDITGKIKEIPAIAGLLSGEAPLGAHYYEAGVYSSGMYTGYKRIIVTKEPTGPGDPRNNVLLTKDNLNFIFEVDLEELKDLRKKIDAGDDLSTSYPLDGFNIKMISGVTILPPIVPKVFTLNDSFGMLREAFLVNYTDSGLGKKDSLGNIVYEWTLVTDLSKYHLISTPISRFPFYIKPYSDEDWTYSKGEDKTVRDTYLLSSTAVFVTDPTGLVYSYKVGLLSDVTSFDKRYKEYVNSGYKVDYPKVGYHLSSSDFRLTQPSFSSYVSSFPHSCAVDENTNVLKNISVSDLTEVGFWNGITMYGLKDQNHRLNWLEWQVKISSIEDEYFPQINNKAKRPTYEEYVSKLPLLFFKDYWGRWVSLGEFDYKLMGGCGKPVIYLYPPRPTEVTVRFLNPINFSVDIPRYKNGWKVLANPDGTLTDLQPDLTNCGSLNQLPGADYATKACKNNNYPYLYWAGQVIGQPYPNINGGWIIQRNNVAKFLDGKLSEVGLTVKERSNMEEYWVPKMLSHPEPYFRISFLTTQQMNEIAPMVVSPNPDSVYRIFLDFLPLDDPGDMATIKSQVLPRVVRNGFTLVEWGGLNR